MAKKITRVCLDMDGVIADWVSAVALLFCVDPRELYDNWPIGKYGIESALDIRTEELWTIINQFGSEFWRGVKPYSWRDELWDLCEENGAETLILTAPARSPDCAKGKVEWIQDWKGAGFRHFGLMSKKHYCARPDTILIDDSDRNIKEFNESGGIGILFPRPWNRGRDNAEDPIGYVKERMKRIC